MEELTRAERYLFILALVLIVLVYFAGATGIINAAGPQLVSLDLAASGRIPSGANAGTFPAYPQNPTTAGH
jgi:hypothetical protein